jgi:glycosyltransferase involved in cell wall biosynthesis
MRISKCVLEPRYSGAEILVLGLVRAQLAAGVPTALIALRPSEDVFTPELKSLVQLGCEILIPTSRLGRFGRVLWIKRAIRTFRPTVMFAHSALPSVYSRLAVAGSSGVSLVTVLHTDDDFSDRALRAFERIMWRFNSAVVGVSPASIRNYVSRITKRQDIRLIPNGVDVAEIRRASVHRNDVRERIFRAAPGDVILLQVGRISPQKQQRLSVEAFAALSRMMPLDNVRLVFAGMAEYEDYYAEVAEAVRVSRLHDKVEFLGSRSDIPSLLAGADVHLMPSAWEAQGIVALEALASGIYCIFTPLEAFRQFSGMPGVALLPENADATCFARRLAVILEESAASRRYHRSLEMYGFEQCAGEYLSLCRGFDGSKS